MPNYVSVHQMRNHYKGDGVSEYIHKNFEFKVRNEISINSEHIDQSVWNIYMKKGGTLYSMLSINHPMAE